jgi:signal transduction histidine kinase
MSVTMLHITAARMALERDRTPEALDALREAEQQGRTSMSDIRRTVGLLGPDANGAAAPMPGAADLPKLVADFQAAGLDVTLDMSGDVRSLVPAAGLTVFRIAQESLTNVAKHAPGAPARIELVVNADTIRLVVENATPNSAAPSDGGGLGIKGMVERAAVLNGSLVAGPGPDGWSVVLAAPRA